MFTLRLETVLIGDVGQLEHLAFRRRVSELSLGNLGFLLRLTSILQESLFFSGDAVSSLVADIESLFAFSSKNRIS